MKLFRYRPKYHLHMHISLDMRSDLALNPASHLERLIEVVSSANRLCLPLRLCYME